MASQIINRGRGPEIEGTRVTVYRVLDFVREGIAPESISHELDLTKEQVALALDYIATHQAEVDAEYELILHRVNQPNPAWVDAGRALTADELQTRIRSAHLKLPAHADSAGQ